MDEMITKKRGDRVKEELKRRGMKQNALARELHNMSPIVLNDKLAGRKNLTEDDLRGIARIIDVRIEYLMCYDDDPTLSDKFFRFIQQMQNEGELLYTGLSAFASLNGYSVSAKTLSGSIEKVFRDMRSQFTIEKDGKTISLSPTEMNDLENEICEMVETRMKYLFKEKEKNNG